MHLLPGELYPVTYLGVFVLQKGSLTLLPLLPLPKFICSSSLGTKDVLLRIVNLVVIFDI